MKRLKEKLNKNGGFTLVEMLIVVAIIAILVAVSIPMVTGSLDKAKQATDDANIRAAIGAATVEYLSATEQYKAAADNTAVPIGTDGTNGNKVYYVITKGQGSFVTAKPGDESAQYGKYYSPGKCIEVTVTKDGGVTAEFGS